MNYQPINLLNHEYLGKSKSPDITAWSQIVKVLKFLWKHAVWSTINQPPAQIIIIGFP